GIQVRAALVQAVQYRSNFVAEGLVEVVWAAGMLVPLVVVYGDRPSVAGWSYPEAMVVTGCFTLLQGVIEGVVTPAMTALVEHVRKGTLDFLLLKPADAQFLATTSKLLPWKSLNVVFGLTLMTYGVARSGHALTAGRVVAGAVMLAVSVSLLLSLWTCAGCAAFVLGKVDNLTYLFTSVFDAARWPSAVFPGLLRLVFTVVIPLAVMTTFPAEALLGRLEPWRLAAAVAGAVAAAALSRLCWSRSLARYTSAGG
ncbi:MAG: ABC transporter permease, partial [Myxococcales bacterium]